MRWARWGPRLVGRWSADDAVLVHVQDVELAVAVGEVELDPGSGLRLAVAHLRVGVLESVRKVDPGPDRLAIEGAEDGRTDGFEQISYLHVGRSAFDVDRA